MSSSLRGTVFKRGLRARLNIVPITISVFAPWLLFSTLLLLLASSLHYHHPAVTYAVILGCAILVAALGIGALLNYRAKKEDPGTYEPKWTCAFSILMLVAFMWAFIGGECVFQLASLPYLDTESLGTYHSVDPSVTHGAQIMDAGLIYFVNESTLDVTRAMSFQGLDRYCVAPIVRKGKNASSFDFWAVGTNCCGKGVHADFHCGQGNHAEFHSGYRLMDTDARYFYRLAVEQAEAAYSIEALHPLFLHVVEDARKDFENFKAWGIRAVGVSCLVYFVLNAFFVAVVSLLFTKMGFS